MKCVKERKQKQQPPATKNQFHLSAKAVKQSSTEWRRKKKWNRNIGSVVGWLGHWIDRDREKKNDRLWILVIKFVLFCSVLAGYSVVSSLDK